MKIYARKVLTENAAQKWHKQIDKIYFYKISKLLVNFKHFETVFFCRIFHKFGGISQGRSRFPRDRLWEVALSGILTANESEKYYTTWRYDRRKTSNFLLLSMIFKLFTEKNKRKRILLIKTDNSFFDAIITMNLQFSNWISKVIMWNVIVYLFFLRYYARFIQKTPAQTDWFFTNIHFELLKIEKSAFLFDKALLSETGWKYFISTDEKIITIAYGIRNNVNWCIVAIHEE